MLICYRFRIFINNGPLLYLIHHALEPDRRTPVLGLDISLRADAAAATLFGVNGASNAAGRVVWSVTDDGDGRSSSRSRSHGGFDDDPVTMNSVAANVLNEAKARVPYVGSSDARALGAWPEADEWLDGVDLSAVGPGPRINGGGAAAAILAPASVSAPGPKCPAPAPPSPKSKPAVLASSNGGARRALCVGIDAYPEPNALTGCVNDTVIWSKALSTAGFKTLTLKDDQATHAAIVASLRDLVTTAKRGDVLVFQYSGHGTEVPDLDGDEGPEGDGNDQAFVPVDFEDGAFLIDDDIRAVFDLLPPGVNLTAFVDCCHSGTITRMLGRNVDGKVDTTRARFLKHTASWDEWMRAHERFREHENATRGVTLGARGFVDRNALRWVNFSACASHEVALEHDGNGDFSRNVTGLLTGDLTRYSHRALQEAIIGVFGARRKQTPQLDCPDASLDMPLLQSLA